MLPAASRDLTRKRYHVCEARPLKTWEWDVARVWSSCVRPQDELCPYSTCESLALFVVQLILTPEDVMSDRVTLEITGRIS